jgi:hypothetical protein
VNARYVSHVWKVGLELESDKLERGEIERVIRRLLVNEDGKEMQKRGKNLKERCELCIRECGSSSNSLSELIVNRHDQVILIAKAYIKENAKML